MRKPPMPMLALLLTAFCLVAGEPRILGLAVDFSQDTAGPRDPLQSWRWTREEKAQAADFSTVAVVQVDGRSCYRLVLRDGFVWKGEEFRLLNLGTDFFPPETDAIRLHCKVVKGAFTLSVGGPTAYYANSDVYAQAQQVEAAPDWQILEFSLHERLMRNLRRAGYSTKAPRIYYNRWSQEPTSLVMFKGSAGELLIEKAEIIANGRARPYPVFTPEQVRVVGNIVDFSRQTDLSQAFTALMADNQVQEFRASWLRQERVRYPPPILKLATDGGQSVMTARATFMEEIVWFGVRSGGVKGSNALAYRIKLDTPTRHALLGGGAGEPIDFMIYTAPTGTRFDWDRFGPDEALRRGPGPGFDYDFSYRSVIGRTDITFGLYQSRRFVKNGAWTDLIIPLADFVCVYGQGSDEAKAFREQQPLTPARIVAYAWVVPYPRCGRGDSVVSIARLDAVAVPGKAEDLRSYRQEPDLRAVEMVGPSAGGFLHLLPKGEHPGVKVIAPPAAE